MQKDEQLNRLREANLQLRSQTFELNQDVVDLLEIVEIQKSRRSVSHIDTFYCDICIEVLANCQRTAIVWRENKQSCIFVDEKSCHQLIHFSHCGEHQLIKIMKFACTSNRKPH